jgi:hypothetical protein
MTLFRDENLGCKHGVSSGIDWFFKNEIEGVVLEDDVLPLATFFDFCDELLERYRDDKRVGMITGCNLVSTGSIGESSYRFSRYNHIWGWASWRRAWQAYDVHMTAWPSWRDSRGLSGMPGSNRAFESYWRDIFDTTYQKKIDTWDYQWTFACWRTGALTAMPSVNQMRNIGFGSGATHTTGDAPAYLEDAVATPLALPLIHRPSVEQDLLLDARIDRIVFKIDPWTTLKRRLYSLPFLRVVVKATRRLVGASKQ